MKTNINIKNKNKKFLKKKKKSNENYRNTKEDFDNAIQYQNDILQKMPEGSTYRLELAFNGYGLIENTM